MNRKNEQREFQKHKTQNTFTFPKASLVFVSVSACRSNSYNLDPKVNYNVDGRIKEEQ